MNRSRSILGFLMLLCCSNHPLCAQADPSCIDPGSADIFPYFHATQAPVVNGVFWLIVAPVGSALYVWADNVATTPETYYADGFYWNGQMYGTHPEFSPCVRFTLTMGGVASTGYGSDWPNFGTFWMVPNWVPNMSGTLDAVADYYNQFSFGPDGCDTPENRGATLVFKTYGVSITGVGFTGDQPLTSWATQSPIDSPDGSTYLWTTQSSGDPIPAAYSVNTLPTITGRLSANPSLPNLQFRVRARLNDFGGTIVAGPFTVAISGTTGSFSNVPLNITESAVKIGLYSLNWEIQPVLGDPNYWQALGSTGPHKIYWTAGNALNPPFSDSYNGNYSPLYDLALEKACSYVNGNTDIFGSVTAGVAAEVYYNPGATLGSRHPLNGYTTACMCADQSNLLRGLLRSLGKSALVMYTWGGSDSSHYSTYTFAPTVGPSTTPTFRIIKPATDGAVANPHFVFHAIVQVSGSPSLYDPSYGVSYSSLPTFDEMAYMARQFSYTDLPNSRVGPGYTCPHNQ